MDREYGSAQANGIHSVAVDTNGNILVFGNLRGTVNFGNIVLTSTSGGSDLFLLKLSPEGLTTEKNQIHNLTIFPNPVNDFLTLDFSDYNNTTLSVEVFTMLGQKIKVFENINTTETLDLSDLTSGVYLLKISNNETTQSIKIKKL